MYLFSSIYLSIYLYIYYYLCNHLFRSVWNKAYFFVLEVIIHCYFIFLHKLLQFWPLGGLPVVSRVLLTCPIPLFFKGFLTFRHNKIFQVLLVFSLPIPRISHFSGDPWFLLFENDIRNHNLTTGCARWYQDVITYWFSRWQNWEIDVCVSVHVTHVIYDISMSTFGSSVKLVFWAFIFFCVANNEIWFTACYHQCNV